MTWFTDSPFERMMVQKPRARNEKNERQKTAHETEKHKQEQNIKEKIKQIACYSRQDSI